MGNSSLNDSTYQITKHILSILGSLDIVDIGRDRQYQEIRVTFKLGRRRCKAKINYLSIRRYLGDDSHKNEFMDNFLLPVIGSYVRKEFYSNRDFPFSVIRDVVQQVSIATGYITASYTMPYVNKSSCEESYERISNYVIGSDFSGNILRIEKERNMKSIRKSLVYHLNQYSSSVTIEDIKKLVEELSIEGTLES